jgi:hypothetical protein
MVADKGAVKEKDSLRSLRVFLVWHRKDARGVQRKRRDPKG